MPNPSRQVLFVTPEPPTRHSVEGRVIARITESLPLDWNVKVLVVRSRTLSIPKIPKLYNVEIILIPEPQLHWDTFWLRVARIPLEKLAQIDLRRIAQRIMCYVPDSDYIFIFTASPALKLASRKLEAVYSGNKSRENFEIRLEFREEIRVLVFQNPPINGPEAKWQFLFENAKGNHFNEGTFRTNVSKTFNFDSLLNRKYESSGQNQIGTIQSASKNRLINWSSPSQPILESGIVLLTPTIAYLLRPSGFVRKAVELFTSSLTKALYRLFRIGYSASKLLFSAVSAARKRIFGRM